MANLLIVDDDRDSVELLAEVLAEEGHHVRVAHDGLQGLDSVQADTLDLILLDVEMPGLGGPAMAHHLYTQDAGKERIPIVLLSGQADLPRVAAAVGTPYFLTKPFGVDALLALMARVLTERTPPRPRPSQSR